MKLVAITLRILCVASTEERVLGGEGISLNTEIIMRGKTHTWPTEHLDGINVESQGKEGIEMDIKTVSPFHRLCRA